MVRFVVIACYWFVLVRVGFSGYCLFFLEISDFGFIVFKFLLIVLYGYGVFVCFA